MANWLRLPAILTLAMVGACATPPSTGMSFGPVSPMALLVISAPPASRVETVEFRRVDLLRNEFRPEMFTIQNAGMIGNQMNGDTSSGIWLSLQEVPHGDYALVSISTATTGAVSSVLQHHCLRTGAPVFSTYAGKISIVRTEPFRPNDGGKSPNTTKVASDDDVLKEFESARTRYPAITGKAAIADVKTIVTYAYERPDVIAEANRACAEPRAFTPVP